MVKVGTFLLSLVEPIIAKVMMVLGVSLVTIVGFDLLLQELIDITQNSLGGLPSSVLGLFHLAGGGIALGLVFGAIAVRFFLFQIQKATQVMSNNPQ